MGEQQYILPERGHNDWMLAWEEGWSWLLEVLDNLHMGHMVEVDVGQYS